MKTRSMIAVLIVALMASVAHAGDKLNSVAGTWVTDVPALMAYLKKYRSKTSKKKLESFVELQKNYMVEISNGEMKIIQIPKTFERHMGTRLVKDKLASIKVEGDTTTAKWKEEECRLKVVEKDKIEMRMMCKIRFLRKATESDRKAVVKRIEAAEAKRKAEEEK